MKLTHQQALTGGILCVVLGSYLLHNAYESRGKRRPWALSFLPGA